MLTKKDYNFRSKAGLSISLYILCLLQNYNKYFTPLYRYNNVVPYTYASFYFNFLFLKKLYFLTSTFHVFTRDIRVGVLPQWGSHVPMY